MDSESEWAGVAFLCLYHHDARMVRAPGLFAFVHREPGGRRTLLYVDHADCIASTANPGHPAWADALRLGMNEVHVCLKAKQRLDRLQLRHHLIKRCEPLLNLLAPGEETAAAARVASVRRSG